jgi:hypothetical protein
VDYFRPLLAAGSASHKSASLLIRGKLLSADCWPFAISTCEDVGKQRSLPLASILEDYSSIHNPDTSVKPNVQTFEVPYRIGAWSWMRPHVLKLFVARDDSGTNHMQKIRSEDAFQSVRIVLYLKPMILLLQ